jgi:hypothetical protein
MKEPAAQARSAKSTAGHDSSFNCLFLLMASCSFFKSKATSASQNLTFESVSIAAAAALPFAFGMAGIAYMLVAVYARSTVLTQGRLDSPRAAPPARSGSAPTLMNAVAQRNIALLDEWRAERQEIVAGKPAGIARSRSWSAFPRVDPAPRPVRARSAPARPTATRSASTL